MKAILKIGRFCMMVILLSGFFAGPVFSASPFLVNQISFGDSLSDSGNLFLYTSGAALGPPDYWEGRASSGPVWTEELAGFMGLENSFLSAEMILDPPVMPPDPPSLFINNAFAGAVTGPAENSFLSQIQVLVDKGVNIPPDTLVTVWIGSNDMRMNPLPAPDQIAVRVNEVVAGILSGITTLTDTLGATHIAVCNLFDIGSLPDINSTPNLAAAIRAVCDYTNDTLKASLDAFALTHPGVTVYQIDAFGFHDEILAFPEKFGFVNTTQNALAEGLDFTGAAQWVWWDSVHPTSTYHGLFGAHVFGSVFIQAPDPDADYFPTESGSGGVIGIGTGQGQITRVSFIDPESTPEDNRPVDMIHGIVQTEISLSGSDTAEFTLYFAEPLSENYMIFKLAGGEWIDFTEVFELSGGAQGAKISEDRKSVMVRVLDNGDYDQDPAQGKVTDPVAPGLSPGPALPCFIENLVD